MTHLYCFAVLQSLKMFVILVTEQAVIIVTVSEWTGDHNATTLLYDLSLMLFLVFKCLLFELSFLSTPKHYWPEREPVDDETLNFPMFRPRVLRRPGV